MDCSTCSLLVSAACSRASHVVCSKLLGFGCRSQLSMWAVSSIDCDNLGCVAYPSFCHCQLFLQAFPVAPKIKSLIYFVQNSFCIFLEGSVSSISDNHSSGCILDHAKPHVLSCSTLSFIAPSSLEMVRDFHFTPFSAMQ